MFISKKVFLSNKEFAELTEMYMNSKPQNFAKVMHKRLLKEGAKIPKKVRYFDSQCTPGKHVLILWQRKNGNTMETYFFMFLPEAERNYLYIGRPSLLM